MILYKSNGKHQWMELGGQWVRLDDTVEDLFSMKLEGIHYEPDDGMLYFLSDEVDPMERDEILDALNEVPELEEWDDIPTRVDPLADIPMSELVYGGR